SPDTGRGVQVIVVFFFQADDGIRVATVTGVQTCALPISSPLPPGSGGSYRRELNAVSAATRRQAIVAFDRGLESLKVGDFTDARSEERRVGRGRRCGW